MDEHSRRMAGRVSISEGQDSGGEIKVRQIES